MTPLPADRRARSRSRLPWPVCAVLVFLGSAGLWWGLGKLFGWLLR